MFKGCKCDSQWFSVSMYKNGYYILDLRNMI